MQIAPAIATTVTPGASRRLEAFSPRRIAVFGWGRLGDSICRLPLVRALKEAYPYAEMTVLADKPFLEVFSGAPYIDNLIACDVDRLRNWRNFGEELSLLWRLRRTRFDAVFDPWGRKRSARYTLLTGAPIRAGVDLWRKRRMYYNVRVEIVCGSRGESAHLIDHGLLLARAVGVSCGLQYEPIPLSDEDRNGAERLCRELGIQGDETVALNLGAAVREKTWPLERFSRVADHLIARGLQVVALLNPGREDLQRRIVAETGSRVISLPAMNIKRLAAFAERTAMLVTGDTGPLHVWQAMARPVVGVAGPIHPSVFELESCASRAVYHPEACVPASNCNWQGCTRDCVCCIEAVTEDEVIAACEAVLSYGGIPRAASSSGESARTA